MEPINKTKYFLVLIFFSFFSILLRVSYLAVIEKEDRLIQAKKPQIKTIIQRPIRGAIFDRFGFPLAINRIRYDATIYFAHIRQIPRIEWKTDSNGKKVKTYSRKEYIYKLSHLLGHVLEDDPDHIKDLIYAKASLLPHIPFTIKENITEKQYYHLRMLERDWPGLHAEINSLRFYPQYRSCCDIVGYLGAIDKEEYLSMAHQISQLQKMLELGDLSSEFYNRDQVINRLEELKKQTYGLNDRIGKMGLEKQYEKILRGFHGKKIFEVDINGNFLKERSSSIESIDGVSITSTISVELQEFAESLLAKDERERSCRAWSRKFRKKIEQKPPLIKGGAIVAIDPMSGDILALASYPRFDPNAFISPSSYKDEINRWLETPYTIAQIWDGFQPLCIEYYDSKTNRYHLEEKSLTWESYLERVLPLDSPIFRTFEKIASVKNAVLLQEDIAAILYYSGQSDMLALLDSLYPPGQQKKSSFGSTKIEECLNSHKEDSSKHIQRISFFLSDIMDNRDKALVIDLCRLAVHSPSFSDELVQKIGNMSLSEYWNFTKTKMRIEKKIYQKLFPLFHEREFKKWRELHFASFLKQKRAEEKAKKTYNRPYIDYLNQIERRLFKKFWEEHRLFLLTILLKEDSTIAPISLVPYLSVIDMESLLQENDDFLSLKTFVFLLSNDLCVEFLKTLRSFEQLDRPLLSNYPSLDKKENQLEKTLAKAFYPRHGLSYSRSFAYRHSAPLGSIFKIVTAYTALKERYHYLAKTNQKNDLLNPLTMTEDMRWDSKIAKNGGIIMGYDKEQKPIPRFYKGGRLPRSSRYYLGELNLLTAMEQSSNPYFAILAGDHLHDPEELKYTAYEMGLGQKTGIDLPGEISGNLPRDLATNRTGLYSFAIGQHTLVTTPLQVAVMLSAVANGGYVIKPRITKSYPDQDLSIIQRTLFFPYAIRHTLFTGLDRVAWGEKGSARPSIINKLYENPSFREEYLKLKHHFIGKTSTAEFMFKSDYSPSTKAEKYNDAWFGSIAFENGDWNKPELVVIIYLRFGSSGKEAAPLAAQVIKKYREIKEKYEQD